MKKPDRFERMVARTIPGSDKCSTSLGLSKMTSLKLLRRQYRALRRVVLAVRHNGIWVCRDDILAAMERWRRK